MQANVVFVDDDSDDSRLLQPSPDDANDQHSSSGHKLIMSNIILGHNLHKTKKTSENIEAL